jgi:hypothetical protein
MSRRASEPNASNREMNPVKRHYSKPTRKSAINAFCAYCMGCTSVEQGNGQEDHLESGFRTYIRECTSTGCPLFEFRPYKGKSDE